MPLWQQQEVQELLHEKRTLKGATIMRKMENGRPR
jgi:hypothetical protein